MARPPARTPTPAEDLARGKKATQRERLLNGIVAAANRTGYAGASVSAVIAAAGVSRPTFYDYFADRDDCFAAAIADIHRQLALQTRIAVGRQPPARALQAAVAAAVGLAGSEPEKARFLMSESMTGGPPALDARDRGIAEIEAIVAETERQAGAPGLSPDVNPRLVIGGTFRLLATRLRRGESVLPGLADGLEGWITSYERPVSEHRWRGLKPGSPPPRSPYLPRGPVRAPRLGPGRPGMSKQQVAANHRERVLFAAAELAEEKGYVATTVGDITRRAGIDGRAFYRLFSDKQDAFMTAHELGLQQVLNVTADAFFAGSDWAGRVWEAARALTQFLEQDPLITHVGFVEAHAVGPGASQRVHDSYSAFAIFLQEGYLQVPPDRTAPTRAAVEAIITSLFELIYQRARAAGKPKISGLLGHMAFLSLAAFVGPSDADALIAQQTKLDRKTAARPGPDKVKPGR
jgi:AcrR family transcriptional regulator